MSAPALRLERFYDPFHHDRYGCCGPPAMTCPTCGAEGLAGDTGGLLFAPPLKGQGETICESCSAAGADELRARMEAHAATLQDRAAWLLAHATWSPIEVDPNLYVIGPDELAC
jgi:hypothetical protein